MARPTNGGQLGEVLPQGEVPERPVVEPLVALLELVAAAAEGERAQQEERPATSFPSVIIRHDLRQLAQQEWAGPWW